MLDAPDDIDAPSGSPHAATAQWQGQGPTGGGGGGGAALKAAADLRETGEASFNVDAFPTHIARSASTIARHGSGESSLYSGMLHLEHSKCKMLAIATAYDVH